MKKLTTQINESLQNVVNEAANPLSKSVEALFKRIGLKDLKIKVPDTVLDRVVIGHLLMEPSDAGMLKPLFQSIDFTATLIWHGREDEYVIELVYKQKFHTGSATTDSIYKSTDEGKTWTDANGKQV